MLFRNKTKNVNELEMRQFCEFIKSKLYEDNRK